MRIAGPIAAVAVVVLVMASAAAAAPPPDPPTRPFVSFDLAANLRAGAAADEIAGSSTIRFRCASRVTTSDRIWFERRTASNGTYRRAEPAGVSYRSVRFTDRADASVQIRRASVRAPRSSFAGAGAGRWRLRSRMTFTCGDSRAVATSKTLALPQVPAKPSA